ncbi:hypothetical protein [Streptomyces nitrosporeus]|nr:hypothetical protein [Streptomyces nitrosporeus]
MVPFRDPGTTARPYPGALAPRAVLGDPAAVGGAVPPSLKE